LSEEVFRDGAALLEKVCSMGLEGIIAKHRDRPYRSGRTGDWLKIKCLQSESFMIVGYEQALTARGGLGSLLLAGRKGHDWIYVGSVGTGFNTKDAEYLRKTLDRLKTSKPAVPLKGKNLVFAQPTLIAEIEFRGWTHDGSLRHASYKGLREVQDNAAVFDRANGRPSERQGGEPTTNDSLPELLLDRLFDSADDIFDEPAAGRFHQHVAADALLLRISEKILNQPRRVALLRAAVDMLRFPAFKELFRLHSLDLLTWRTLRNGNGSQYDATEI
jgi:hypothetical protein